MSRGNEIDPASVYGDAYNTDNRGKKLVGPDKMAVKAPKPYGGEGRGVEVKATDDYEDELEAKMARMLNRNQHTKQQDASAKAKGSCAACRKTITEDEHWVEAIGKTFHKSCFACSLCKSKFGDRKYYEKGDQAVCADCEDKAAAKCVQCSQACRPDQSSLQALGKQYHTGCFMCQSCHRKLGEGADRTFREIKGKPYCTPCAEKHEK